ncbi:MAG: hypothetical protein AB7O62_02805 [Pirellulales bacterium]
MPMSGPIVRSGPTPEFSKNWDSVFGGKKPAAPAKKADAPKAAKKSAKKPVKKAATKKAAKKGKK